MNLSSEPGGKTILVVDDRAESRRFLTSLLSYKGYAVREALNGQDALLVTRETHPDLVIADILMPKMDGYEYVRQLRLAPDTAAIPVIFYTASYIEGGSRVLARSCGVSRFLVKPAEPMEILAAVAEILGAKAMSHVAWPAADFERNHLQLVTDKLSDKVEELEQLNAELEHRVADRTASLESANARLVGLNKMKDEFLAVISHDLRSPLSGIALVAEVLISRGDVLPADTRKEMLENIRLAARQQIALVHDVLDVARHECGSARLQLEELLVSDIVSDSIKTLAFNAHAKEITVSQVIWPDEAHLEADRLKLLQIVNNLLGNAIKFTPLGGHVSVCVAPENVGIRLSVADNGIGIPPEEMPRVLEKFNCGHGVGTSGERGTGLGLAIVRQLVELHGGRIELSSAPGRGTTITVHLPRKPIDPMGAGR